MTTYQEWQRERSVQLSLLEPCEKLFPCPSCGCVWYRKVFEYEDYPIKGFKCHHCGKHYRVYLEESAK